MHGLWYSLGSGLLYRSLGVDGIKTPHTHVGVPFAVEFSGGDIDLSFDELSRHHALDLVDLVSPARQANCFGVLFIRFDDQVLFTPRTFGACSFGKTAESHHFTCDFHICISFRFHCKDKVQNLKNVHFVEQYSNVFRNLFTSFLLSLFKYNQYYVK